MQRSASYGRKTCPSEEMGKFLTLSRRTHKFFVNIAIHSQRLKNFLIYKIIPVNLVAVFSIPEECFQVLVRKKLFFSQTE